MQRENGLVIRPYQDKDFPAIHKLNEQEGWSNLVEKHQQTKAAWQGSNVALVAEQGGQVIGCLRALTDGAVTLYICELLIEESSQYPTTRLELLASQTSHSYYEMKKFRPFYGFRKTYEE